MQVYRLFETVHILLERKTVTARELAERFGVSTRTIYRDIDSLSAAGVPVYAVQGKGGGISILEDYILDKTLISDEEQKQILLSLQGLSATGHPDLESTLSKLSSLFRKSGDSWIEVDFSRWGGHVGDRYVFELLKAAVAGRESIRFQYYAASGEVGERTVYPLKLVFKGRNWYLQSYCLLRRDFRVFKIVRMRRVERTGQRFDAERYLPALPPVEEANPESDRQRPAVQLKIRFAPQAAYRLLDEFGPEQLLQEPDGHYLVTAEFPWDNWLMGFLLSFGEWAEVLDPPELRQALLEQAKRMTEIYGSSS